MSAWESRSEMAGNCPMFVRSLRVFRRDAALRPINWTVIVAVGDVPLDADVRVVESWLPEADGEGVSVTPGNSRRTSRRSSRSAEVPRRSSLRRADVESNCDGRQTGRKVCRHMRAADADMTTTHIRTDGPVSHAHPESTCRGSKGQEQRYPSTLRGISALRILDLRELYTGARKVLRLRRGSPRKP